MRGADLSENHRLVSRGGVELHCKSSKESIADRVGGAESGALVVLVAVAAPALEEIFRAWPTLPEPITIGALALISAAWRGK